MAMFLFKILLFFAHSGSMLVLRLFRPEIARFYRIYDLSARAYRKGHWNRAERFSREGLEIARRLPNDWNYGNVVHNCNQILGLLRLREEKIEAAKQHLLDAGNTAGSPQLKSYGPKMILARELVKRGERDVVICYLDAVAKFWAVEQSASRSIPNYSKYVHEKQQLMRQWKKEIHLGKMPQHKMWLSNV